MCIDIYGIPPKVAITTQGVGVNYLGWTDSELGVKMGCFNSGQKLNQY